jgi:branched-chain amino acid transport system substrate-binding protein
MRLAVPRPETLAAVKVDGRVTGCKALAAGLVMLSVAALSACGGGSGRSSAGAANAAVTSGGRVVDVYSSLPMRGPSGARATAVVDGIKLALAQAGSRAGQFTVQYTALDDSGGPDGWDASQTAADARKAAADPRAVYYIGEFDDDASEISMPILNEAGVPQVSPTNTYVGLTTSAPGSAAGEPRRYWPTGTRTYLRIVPIDSVQGAAVLLAMQQAGCARVAVVNDGEAYGDGLARLVDLEKGLYGVNVVSMTAIDPDDGALRSSTAKLRLGRPDCLVLAGVASKGAVQLTRAVHDAVPAAKIFAPAAMCTDSWTNPKDGGVPASVGRLIECTAVTRDSAAYPGGKAFLLAYKARYGPGNPSPYAILGYEAMKLGLSTIAGLGPNGDSKSAVVAALFSTTDRHSVLGTYSLDGNGDTTLRSYGLYKVGPSGNPRFVRTITPPRVL